MQAFERTWDDRGGQGDPVAGPAPSDLFDPACADLSLFGCWAAAPAYGKALPEDDALVDDVRAVVLEIKSAAAPAVSPAEALRQLLNEMTVEMREQFESFRAMRAAADAALQGGDEAAGKLARADIKAATDAMSLIVRTLEKVDSLQRQLARDREDDAERTADASGYEEAKKRFLQMIEDRANEGAIRLYEEWKRDGPPAGVLLRSGGEAAQPAHAEAEAGSDIGQTREDFNRGGQDGRRNCGGA
ncbi:hypothetical protein [Pseudorhizobium marinum]|uniref:hypothetical protein n=1 Tax=Pseudorhizobium marinum TaxID=1496690 RepID=UPI0006913ABE|nr:hypothetical protein [Pseudorhizobium marinum]